jgi:CDP-glycerol glycerophosphotransferase
MNPQPPRLSIVVPFYNVESYFDACLASLERQSFRDLEVIMVDDGSPDGSAVIAKSYAERDARFRIMRQHNLGLGPARNAGMSQATGEYLAFADSDDVVARHAYELLVGTLDRSGSDLACGNVDRFGAAGRWRSPLHAEPFATTRIGTHIRRFPALLNDRTVWNKVYRRSFWTEHGFAFPGSLFEDGPVTVAAHVKAAAVDVLAEVVYYWRLRDEGTLSITQRSAETGNVIERLASVRTVGEFLARHAPEIKPEYDRSVLSIDLRTAVRAVATADRSDCDGLFDLVKRCLDGIPAEVREGASALDRLKYHLVERDQFDELAEVLRRADLERDGFTVTRRGRVRPRWYADHPFRGDQAVGVPDSVYDVTDELELVSSIDDVTWSEGRLRIEGHAYIERLDLTPEARIDVWLQHARTERKINLAVRRLYRPEVTADAGQGVVGYCDSGFAVEVDPERLKINGRWRTGDWEVHVAVRTAGMRRTGPIAKQARTPARWRNDHEVADGVRVCVAQVGDEAAVVRVKKIKALATGAHPHGDAVNTVGFEGWVEATVSGQGILRAARQPGSAVVTAPAMFTPIGAGRSSFRASLPLARLLEPRPPNAAPAQVGDAVEWNLELDAGGGPVRLTADTALPVLRHVTGGREVTVTPTRFGNLTVVERSRRLVVTHFEWFGEPAVQRSIAAPPARPVGKIVGEPTGKRSIGAPPARPAGGPAGKIVGGPTGKIVGGRGRAPALILAGTFADETDLPTDLVVRHRRSGAEHRFPLTWDHGRFTVAIEPVRAGHLPMGSGTWDLLAMTATGRVGVVAERSRLGELPDWHTVGQHECRLASYQTDSLNLKIRPALADNERGPYARREFWRREHPALAARPTRDLVVFDSYFGRQYSCSPRAIYQELVRRGSDLECVWVTQDGQFETDGATTVLRNSRAHFEAISSARFLVNNSRQPPEFLKRDDQVYLQTWHGTPLKRLGSDVPNDLVAARAFKDDLVRDVASWDYLVSPSPFATETLCRAFDFRGEVIESGYPRNDLLSHTGGAEIGARVRRELGIPDGKRAVLYAPTWREDHYLRDDGGSLGLADLPDDHVLLLRRHYFIAPRGRVLEAPRAVDVSHYPDITELYLAADVLVTDYSSAMFDFAVTGKPMVFYAYDLERYRDTLRGLYIDLETVAPGRVVRTAAELAQALMTIEADIPRYAAKYAAFLDRFCPFDDGQAAARVVDRVFI